MDHKTSSSNFSATVSYDKFERFELWLRDNGASFDQLELREYSSADCSNEFGALKVEEAGNASPSTSSLSSDDAEEKKEQPLTSEEPDEAAEMRGVHAKVTIPPNSVCMAIPKKCLITVEMGQATEIGMQIMNSDLDLDAPKHIYLMIYILQDRLDPESFFRPYYDILPSSLSNMPIFWSQEELKRLEGSYLLNQIADRIEAIEEDYKAICEICPQLADIATLDEFKWARMCVCSRNFGLQVDCNRTSALVPHADMLNHYRPRETKWTFDDERQAFTITTLQTIQAGAQIYDSYGQKCNHRFLLNYGFAIENNIELDGFCPNEVPLELTIAPSDACFDAKLDFWCREDSPPIKRVRVCVSNNENTKIMMSMMRVIVADAGELEAITGSGAGGGIRCSGSGIGVLVYRTCRDVRFPLSLRNENAALHNLLAVVRRALLAYPTTLAQDNEQLAGNTLPQFSNARHAVIQVRGEKEVLHHFEDFVLTSLQVIDIDQDEQFDAAIKSMEGMGKHHTIIRYCSDVIGAIRREEKRRVGRAYLCAGSRGLAQYGSRGGPGLGGSYL
mmetsp:Transcript_18601/g.27293  ORF Transcript_18601/g.27293 Transcript_18601/m.27293 type:complete len:560 (-) Transcript_18601:604-2283(-)|eukprot:CAMPEP_0195508088 /NCGR_PEP_ID=MMETSP0794_2-20130614/1392_1 /TAXON_ID=515487 /ORGANISM="Stephanopyxis turris, Strain CCMP 815" /LENGTH=559 /DNA_ID=CAMNT_0040634963 /DNA_START=107 /DNA_END=1786 /DNA_ORIENTATION=+